MADVHGSRPGGTGAGAPGAEIEVTPEMIEAGKAAASGELVWATEISPLFSSERLVVGVFQAMAAAAPAAHFLRARVRAVQASSDNELGSLRSDDKAQIL